MTRLLFIGRMTIFAYGMRRMPRPSTRHLSPASQKFMPSLGLGIGWIFGLQPAGCVVLVNAEFSLRHNPLKVAGANFREKTLPVLLDVLRVKQPGTLRGPDESRESLLSFDKGICLRSPSSHRRSNACSTGSPFRLSNWLNWLTPFASRQMISPSMMAFCTGSLTSDRLSVSNPRFL